MDYVQFYWADYALFGTMFGLSALIGVYFGWFGKQNTTKDYLQGGRQMKVFPVAMSLVASTVSGISLLGLPAEVYMYGTQIWMMAAALVLVGCIVYFTFLPVFYKLQLTSMFEYLEIRYDKNMRMLFSVTTSFTNMAIIPILIYAPSLAFNQVTGYSIHSIAAIMSLICIFYTTMGGVKAVIWADTLQFTITLGTLIFVLVKGTISVGGLSVVWKKAEKGDRIDFFNMNLDPTLRNSFWTVLLGNVGIWSYIVGSSQSTMQRFLSVPTYSDSKKILIIYITFFIITKSIGCFSGLIVYAKYYNCDPLTAGYIKKSDQILSYFVADVAREIPGISGLFVCGLFNAALSTVSTFLNAISANIYSDVICLFVPANISEKASSTILKLITLVVGIITLGLVFVVEKLGTVIQIFSVVCGLSGGPLLGLYLMGMIFPMANRKGALCGTVISLLCMAVLVIGNQALTWNGMILTNPKPLNTYGCNGSITELWNTTFSTTNYLEGELTSSFDISEEAKKPFWLFIISFYYYILIGSILTIIVSLIVSWMTKSDKEPSVDLNLLCPFAQRLFKKSNLSSKYKISNTDITNNKIDKDSIDTLLKH